MTRSADIQGLVAELRELLANANEPTPPNVGKNAWLETVLCRNKAQLDLANWQRYLPALLDAFSPKGDAVGGGLVASDPDGNCERATDPHAIGSGWGHTGAQLMTMIDELRSDEGATVTIVADNADFNGQPDRLIICNGPWTDWQDRHFGGETIAQCLRDARSTRELVTTSTTYTPRTPAVGGIPAGMVAYGPDHPDYPNEPKDWHKGPYMTRDGGMYHMRGYGWKHGEYCTSPTSDWDRIAYTPVRTPSDDASAWEWTEFRLTVDPILRAFRKKVRGETIGDPPLCTPVARELFSALVKADAILAALPTTDGAGMREACAEVADQQQGRNCRCSNPQIIAERIRALDLAAFALPAKPEQPQEQENGR